LLKAHGLLTSPAFIVMKAADEFRRALGGASSSNLRPILTQSSKAHAPQIFQ
jgi:hypothetical protein